MQSAAMAKSGSIWRSIPKWPDYQVNQYGHLRHHQKNGQYNTVKSYPRRRYNVAEIGTKPRQSFHVSWLVATLFVPNPRHYHYIKHLNHDYHDDRASNLRWYGALPSTDYYHHHLEHWRTIESYPNYQVSDLGRVRAKDFDFITSNGHHHYLAHHILKPHLRPDHYLRICLFKNHRHRFIFVHRLVAKAFIPNPHHYPEINHKNEKRNDDRACNLEWCTQAYNNSYGHRNQNCSLYNLRSHMHTDYHGQPISKQSSREACQYLKNKYRHGKEYWKPIPGFLGYYASNLGQIYYHNQKVNPQYSKCGSRVYYHYHLYSSLHHQWDTIPAEKLIASTFLKNPHHYSQVNHINEEPRDNRACNLEWCNAAYNSTYRNHIYHLTKSIGGHPVKLIRNGHVFVGQSRESAVRHILKTLNLPIIYYGYVEYRVRKSLSRRYPKYHGFHGYRIGFMKSVVPYDFAYNLKLIELGKHLTSPILFSKRVRAPFYFG